MLAPNTAPHVSFPGSSRAPAGAATAAWKPNQCHCQQACLSRQAASKLNERRMLNGCTGNAACSSSRFEGCSRMCATPTCMHYDPTCGHTCLQHVRLGKWHMQCCTQKVGSISPCHCVHHTMPHAANAKSLIHRQARLSLLCQHVVLPAVSAEPYYTTQCTYQSSHPSFSNLNIPRLQAAYYTPRLQTA